MNGSKHINNSWDGNVGLVVGSKRERGEVIVAVAAAALPLSLPVSPLFTLLHLLRIILSIYVVMAIAMRRRKKLR